MSVSSLSELKKWFKTYTWMKDLDCSSWVEPINAELLYEKNLKLKWDLDYRR